MRKSLQDLIPQNTLGEDEDLTALKDDYRELYGFANLDNLQVREIAAAEEKITECEDCTGSCLKEIGNKYMFPVIRNIGGELNIAYTVCKWGKRRRLCNKFKYSQVPLRFADKTFDDYAVDDDNEHAVKGAKWFIQGESQKGLFLYGETGTGKTFLAALVAKAFLAADKSVVFGDVPSLLAEIKATFDKNGGSTEVLFDKYSNCDLLILDDLGAGQLTDWSVGVIYRIVNSRYNDNKPLLVTCNYDLDRLEEVLRSKDGFAGKRVVSRLREMTYKVYLGENDRRK